VNYGRLGFLCGADGSALTGSVDAALRGEGVHERRCTLRVGVTAGGRDAGTHHALNEVFVGRGPGGRAVDLAVAVDGEPLLRAVCDGVIVATPTGSTAYSMSAGGPIIAADLRGMLVVPVNPHTLASRPVLVGDAAAVTLSLPDGARSDACVVVDGDTVPCRNALERVDVDVGEHDVTLVRLDGRRSIRALRDAFFEV
jgi:NAD+ kinase